MNKLTVAVSVQKSLASGVKLLSGKDFKGQDLPEGLVDLYTKSQVFLGRAYLSPQNKGVGWYLSAQKIDLDQAYFEGLFSRAKTRRSSYAQSDLTTAYRLFNQDGDDFGGLTIDCYGDFALFSWYNPFVYSISETIVAAFRAVFPEIIGAYEKIRFKGLDFESRHLYGQEQEAPFDILENGVTYSVFLNDGLMTGIFLDQHEVREGLVNGLAAGKSLLNLFSYTAAFSVAAAMGGAHATTSVDLAKRSRDLSQAHFTANHLSLDQHQFVVMDAFDYLKYAQRKGLTFDVIVIDPPSFARNKKRTFSVSKDYHQLIAQSLPLLSPGGQIIASTNAANLSVSQFRKELDKGFGDRPHSYQQLQQLPADFCHNPKDDSSNYLKVFTIKVD